MASFSHSALVFVPQTSVNTYHIKLLGKIFTITVTASCTEFDKWYNRAISAIDKNKSPRYFGLDCEWVMHGKKRAKVQLLQLCHDNNVILFQIAKCEELPQNLTTLLRTKKNVLCGVAVQEDVNKIEKDYGFVTKAIVADLRDEAEFTYDWDEYRHYGLKSLSEEFLSLKLEKDKTNRCCDWSRNQLSMQQIEYAAKDAIASLYVYKEIEKDTRKIPVI